MGTHAVSDRQHERELLAGLAAKTLTKIPALNGRVEKACKLVLGADVTLHPDGTALVNSLTDPTRAYQVTGSPATCQCKDYDHAPEHLCCHRLAVGFTRKVQELLGKEAPQEAPQAPEPVQGIDPRWIQMIHGKPFVVYAGLLHMAREAGLARLEAQFISVTPDMALASATATFADGRVFREAADATPGNVGAQIRPHFPRMALTRAKARALRDALGLELCSVEELD